MTMNMTKQLWTLARMALPALGFALMFGGAYLLSLQTEYEYSFSVLHLYIMIFLGFAAVFTGVIWTICYSMKRKTSYRGRCEQRIQVFTVERPSSFPPSYEESEGNRVSNDTLSEIVVTVDGVDMVMNLAPPLYSQDGSKPPDCTFSWEQPPRYSVVEGLQQGQTEQQTEASSRH